jgi:hypothetical protein
MKARTNRGRALVAGTVVAASCVTGLGAAHAQTSGIRPPRQPVAQVEFWLDPATIDIAEPVVARGNACVDTAGTPGEVFVRVTSEGGPIVETSTRANPGGDWTVRLSLPNALGAGEYPVVARCDQLPSWGDEQGFDYGVRILTVTRAPKATAPDPTSPSTRPAPKAKPARPVRATPRYTG